LGEELCKDKKQRHLCPWSRVGESFRTFFGHTSNCALFEKSHLNRNKANAIILCHCVDFGMDLMPGGMADPFSGGNLMGLNHPAFGKQLHRGFGMRHHFDPWTSQWTY
jgi:hypothetical protein